MQCVVCSVYQTKYFYAICVNRNSASRFGPLEWFGILYATIQWHLLGINSFPFSWTSSICMGSFYSWLPIVWLDWFLLHLLQKLKESHSIQLKHTKNIRRSRKSRNNRNFNFFQRLFQINFVNTLNKTSRLSCYNFAIVLFTYS